MADRRTLLTLLFLGLCAPGLPAFAKDNDGGKGESGGKGDSGKGDSKGDSDKGDNDSESDDRDDARDEREDARDDRKDAREDREKDDDERIREAVARGDAEPLKDILKAVRRRYRGKVVSIRLTGPKTNLQYRIRLIDDDDRLVEVRVNARTARIVGSR